MSPKLLSRDQFREGVFARNNGRCVVCGETAVDAHHIIERRLFQAPHEFGGYFLDNGASVCQTHHIQCETTEISVEEIREAAGIKKAIVPDHLYPDTRYTKWGDPILDNGQRVRGELFFDESVQKVLAAGGKLDLYSPHVKYPRTHHVPWSDGVHDDDRVLKDLSGFEGCRVIVTTKMDGENTSVYRDYLHARSIDGRNHPSRAWVKQFCSTFQGDIPDGWRVCGENLYARHSIAYDDLPSYFLGFSIWNERNVALSWDETLEWFALFGITPVPVLYDGIYDEAKIKALWSRSDWDRVEGYVVRDAGPIAYGEFRKKVGKFVRAGHVATAVQNWQTARIIPNGLTK